MKAKETHKGAHEIYEGKLDKKFATSIDINDKDLCDLIDIVDSNVKRNVNIVPTGKLIITPDEFDRDVEDYTDEEDTDETIESLLVYLQCRVNNQPAYLMWLVEENITNVMEEKKEILQQANNTDRFGRDCSIAFFHNNKWFIADFDGFRGPCKEWYEFIRETT